MLLNSVSSLRSRSFSIEPGELTETYCNSYSSMDNDTVLFLLFFRWNLPRNTAVSAISFEGAGISSILFQPFFILMSCAYLSCEFLIGRTCYSLCTSTWRFIYFSTKKRNSCTFSPCNMISKANQCLQIIITKLYWCKFVKNKNIMNVSASLSDVSYLKHLNDSMRLTISKVNTGKICNQFLVEKLKSGWLNRWRQWAEQNSFSFLIFNLLKS